MDKNKDRNEELLKEISKIKGNKKELFKLLTKFIKQNVSRRGQVQEPK